MSEADERPAGGIPTGLSQNSAAIKLLGPSKESSGETAAQQAVAAADPWAVSAWCSAILCLASTGRLLSADDCHDLGAPAPDRPNPLGGLFSGAVRAGRIRVVGYTASRRLSRHGGVQCVYVGTPTP